MQAKYTKDEDDPSYDNLQSTVCKGRNKSKVDHVKLILKKPVFKWIPAIITITVLSVLIVVPTVLEVTKHELIAGTWGNWTSFSVCSHSCGGGTQYRVRSCDNPSPAFDGKLCDGNYTDIQSCSNNTCPAHGGWGNWKSFSECSHSCSGGTQTRQRDCNNPSPAYGGMSCLGNQNETQSCNTGVCPVHGVWGSWTDDSGCSHSCGGGTSYRLRMCNNPNPSFGGNWCLGNITEFQACNTQRCPDYRSAFSVRYPVDGPTSGTITFSTVITNIGGHYDTTTGRFTCQYPGIYVFLLNLYKYGSTSYTNVYCYIKKNGSNMIYTLSNPHSSSDSGWYSSSNTLVVKLSHGDKIHLGSCSSASTMWTEPTSFSGFLLQAD